ncbi:MAG: (d)CMP kinase [Candidatus Desantisbacteria bacterium]
MNNKKNLIITIDGPAGVGKSTISKAIANRLRLKHIDSGAIYRAITYQVLKEKGDIGSENDIVAIAKKIKIEYKSSDKIVVDGDVVTEQIRSHEVTRSVSTVAAYKGVRDVVVEILRGLTADCGVVMEGRDIGSVVLPDADFKFYLDATIAERAQRRYKELKKRDKDAELYKIQLEIKHRDKKDSSREIAPLVFEPGATYIDTSALTLKEVSFLITKKINSILRMDGMSFFNSSNLFYCSVCFVLRLIYVKYLKLDVQGLSNIPATGGVLLVCNHLSHLDPPAVAVSLQRQVLFIARSTLFKVNPLFGWILERLNVYPINREGMDREVFKRVMAILDAGRICLVFPEGTRSRTGQLQSAKPGIGMIISMAKNNGVKFSVIPCKITGSDKALPVGAKWIKKEQIQLSYGKPIDLSDLIEKQDKHTYQAIAGRLMEHIGGV